MIKNDYNYNGSEFYRGPTGKLKKYKESRIKREISVLQKSNEQWIASKLKINLTLAVTKSTIQVN